MPQTVENQLASPLQLRPVRRWLLVLVLILAAHGVLSLVTFFDLPDTIPLHFNASGTPDRFGPPTMGSWFASLLVSLLSSALVGAIALSIYKIPEKFISVPRKREFMQLAQDNRRRLLGIISTHTLVLGATMALIFAILQLTMALTAHGMARSFPAWIVFVAMALMLGEIVVMIVTFSRGLESELRRKGEGR